LKLKVQRCFVKAVVTEGNAAEHGDQIGQTFANWVIFTLESFFENLPHVLGLLFSHG
jgi:hypothetical protein